MSGEIRLLRLASTASSISCLIDTVRTLCCQYIVYGQYLPDGDEIVLKSVVLARWHIVPATTRPIPMQDVHTIRHDNTVWYMCDTGKKRNV